MDALHIPLANRSRPACIAAIDALTASFAVDDLDQRFPDELRIVFELPDGTKIDARSFFGQVESQGAANVPALRLLLETALGHSYAEVWAENGPFLQHAMKALAVLDPDALPLLKRYVIDLFHNEYPAKYTFPAMIKAHGWNDERIAFILDRVVLPYLGHEWSADMWRKHGLSAALAQRHTPTEFVVSRNIDDIPDDDDLVEFVEAISPLNPWEREVFLLMGADLAGADIPSEVGPDGRDRVAERAKASEEGLALRRLRQALQGEIILDENVPGPPRNTPWFTPFNLFAAAFGASYGAFWAWNSGLSAPTTIAILILGNAALVFAVAVAFDISTARIENCIEDGREAAILKLYTALISRAGYFSTMGTAGSVMLVHQWNTLGMVSITILCLGVLACVYPIFNDFRTADPAVQSFRRARLIHAAIMVVVTILAAYVALAALPMLAAWLNKVQIFGLGPHRLARVMCILGGIGVIWACNAALARWAAQGAASVDMRTWPASGIYAGAVLRDLKTAR